MWGAPEVTEKKGLFKSHTAAKLLLGGGLGDEVRSSARKEKNAITEH